MYMYVQMSTPPMSANVERKLRYPPILYTITCYFSLALRCYVVVCCGVVWRGGAVPTDLLLRSLSDSPLPGLSPLPDFSFFLLYVRTYVRMYVRMLEQVLF